MLSYIKLDKCRYVNLLQKEIDYEEKNFPYDEEIQTFLAERKYELFTRHRSPYLTFLK